MPGARAIKPRRGEGAAFTRPACCSSAAALFSPFHSPRSPRPRFADDDKDNTLVLTTKHGKVVIRLRPDLAPKTVAQIKTLTKRKFYDGIVFHRVIPGFMAQTGDPTGTGSGGSDLPDIPAEFTPTPFKRGTVGMARAERPELGQFAVLHLLRRRGFLDGKYTVFGEVVSGMDVVDKIKAGTADNNGAVDNPDKIVTLRLASRRTPKRSRSRRRPTRRPPSRPTPRPAKTDVSSFKSTGARF